MNPPPLPTFAPVAPRPPFCAPGDWPWDHWERFALASGLAAGLATLGRAVMREARQHAWCERLKKECGLRDDGRVMLARVLRHPARTAARWHWLLVTDGLRFDPWRHEEFYEDSPCWKTMRAKWDRERQREAASTIILQPSSFNHHPSTIILVTQWPASPSTKSTGSKAKPISSP